VYVSLSARFLRLAPILLVDYPAERAVTQADLPLPQPGAAEAPPLHLKGMEEGPLSNAMVHFYLRNQEREVHPRRGAAVHLLAARTVPVGARLVRGRGAPVPDQGELQVHD